MICRVGNGPAIFVSTTLIGKFMKPYKIYTPRFGKPFVTFFDRKITRSRFSREKAWDLRVSGVMLLAITAVRFGFL